MDNINSNSPLDGNCRLADQLKSEQNTLIDMGADEFTVGRLHPMIDFSLRTRRIVQEAFDPETAVILIDIVLGYGANSNPLAEIAPAVTEARKIAAAGRRTLPIVASVVGTDKDPQNLRDLMDGLTKLDVIAMKSTREAAKLAGYIMRKAAGKT